jgi:hypothetical protein
MVTDASPDTRCRGTDEHRCGIDSLNRSVSRNWPLQLMPSVLVDRATVSRAPQKCRPHPMMDRLAYPGRFIGLAIGLDGWPLDPNHPVYRGAVKPAQC